MGWSVKFLFPVFALFLFCKFCFSEEPLRTWTSSDGRTLEARFVEQVGSNVRIKNEAGREFTLPITRFSQADQEYVVEAVARVLFQSPEAFEGRGKGAIIIASATGKVSVVPAPRYSGSQEVKPVARDVIVGIRYFYDARYRVEHIRLEHANITVSDPEKTAAWMQTVFGWRIRWQGQH